ncbi:fimbrial protein [Metapseudomonas resinovorans]|uniref:Fimbrial-type adhesion domain-containing protein n=1 Tax=Metapseudomonas resinovorans NBRC 106553 TaxID=1245471 RepID=S6AFB6_METRE|nr:fimbrial protein [Pseudomonas resinovorans]BAN46420.1 hypothetical protein PCA10_06880 [Pseudomonas resinovorans NBRC 106553]
MAGDCTPTGGARQFEFPFSATFTSPDDNAPQRVLANAHAWNLGQNYPGSCTCSRPGVTYGSSFIYTTRTDLPAGYSAEVGGQTRQFYQVNRNIQVASEVWVAGQRNAYMPVPLSAVSNLMTVNRICSTTGITTTAFASGGMGRLHLMIDRPFIGEVVIPRTRLLDMVGAYEVAPTAAAQPMASVWMSGRVVVPQSCRLAPGQVTTIDFGQLNPGELPMPGQNPRRTVSRVFQVQCENIAQMVSIDLSLEGITHSSEPSALAVNERRDLAIVLRHDGRQLQPVPQNAKPGPEHIIPLTFDQGSQRGEFQLEAYPIKLTPILPPGTFNSQVTLKFDFR